MKQIFVRKREIAVEDVPPPAISDREVLVANAFSAISGGTELSAVQGSGKARARELLQDSNLRRKAIELVMKKGAKEAVRVARELQERRASLGYSCAGIILATGRDITDLSIGDRVACAGGKANHAEIVAVSRNLVVKIPENVSFEEAAFATIGSIALHSIRRAQLQIGETVVIIGVGLLGQIAVQLAKANGCKAIAVDADGARVELAKELGADLGLRLEDVERELSMFTGRIGADCVIICAATRGSEPVNQAMRLIRNRGRVIVVGDVGLNVGRQKFYEKEGDLLISRSYGPGRYDQLYEEKGIDYPIAYVRWTVNRNMRAFLDLVSEKKINLKPLIRAIFDIGEAEKAYELLLDGVTKPVGILIKYDPYVFYPKEKQAILTTARVEMISKTVRSGEKLNAAVIGVGSFAKGTLIPLMSKIPDYYLRAVVAATGMHAKQAAEQFKAKYYTTNYKEVLSDAEVDLVMIATPHNLHYQMVVDAAKAGKAIYVEKPLCLTEHELDEITKVVSETKVPLTVGFNRRYSPLALKAKELLRRKHKPLIINYRVNAGSIPKEHWVHDPEVGGGRIVGECCHFFDFFNFIVESEVQSVDAKVVPINNITTFVQDNLVTSIRWVDGSITTLTYTSLGHPGLHKEYIEMYADGSTIIIDDFREMRLYGFEEKSIKLKQQDKGNYNQLIETANLLRNKPSRIISFPEVIKSMKLTFEVKKKMQGQVEFNTTRVDQID